MMEKFITYDPSVIQDFASRLYRRANSIVASYAFLGVVIGAVVGSMLGAGSESLGMLALIGSLVGAAIGFAFGQERAFKLKLEAQVALCQVQIEKNTAAR